jgi:hypothetical protein
MRYMEGNRLDFRLENEMVQPAVEWLRSLRLLIKREFNTPWGVCDLVGLRFNEARVKERLCLGQRHSIGSALRIMVLQQIPDCRTHHSVTVERLGQKLDGLLTSDDLGHEIARLVESNFVRRTRTGSLQKRNGWAPLQERIVALELKLSRVQDAYSQALSNLMFADESYIGLPAIAAERLLVTRRCDEFRQTGVGILSISRDSCTIVLPSTRRSLAANRIVQMHCAERFWRTRARSVDHL